MIYIHYLIRSIQGNPLKDFWEKSRKGNSQGKAGSKLRWLGVFRAELERASGRARRREGMAEEAREGCWEV